MSSTADRVVRTMKLKKIQLKMLDRLLKNTKLVGSHKSKNAMSDIFCVFCQLAITQHEVSNTKNCSNNDK